MTTTPPSNASTNVAQLAGTTTDTNSGSKSAGTLRVVIATDQPQLTNKLLVTPDANSAVNVAQMNGVAVTMGNGTAGTGVQRVAIASDNTAFSVNATPTPATSGGPSKARVMSAASTNATSTKASAGQIYGWYFYNNTASAKFVKFYNKASSPTVGTDTPTETIAIPSNGGTNIEFSMGVPYATGIAYAITGAIADNDTTAVAANDVTGFFLYK